MNLPVLGTVPPNHHELVIKATSSGITLLKQNRFRSRYTGNKFSAVDINGNLWLKSSDLKKEIHSSGDRPKKKKAHVETQADLKKVPLNECPNIQKNLSTKETDLPTGEGSLSTKNTQGYRVNKREVRQRLLGYINTMRGQKELYFWTVTFPPGIEDNTCYRLLNIWLTSLRQYRMLHDYIWVAERQNNGNIHFHIAIPHKMPVQRANAMMRGTLKNFIKTGEIQYSAYQCNRYNGVDIAKNRETKRVTNFAVKKGSKSLIGYLTKYITKNDTAFSHLAWHNSRGFSSIFTGVTFTVPEFVTYGFNSLIDRTRVFDTEYFKFIPWLNDPPKLLTDHLYKINSYLQLNIKK